MPSSCGNSQGLSGKWCCCRCVASRNATACGRSALRLVQRQFGLLADDRGVQRAGRHVLRGQDLAVRRVELRREPLGRHVEPVADDAREGDFQPRRVDQPLRDRPHGLAGLRRRRGAVLGQPGDREAGERHAEDVGVLRGQHARRRRRRSSAAAARGPSPARTAAACRTPARRGCASPCCSPSPR